VSLYARLVVSLCYLCYCDVHDVLQVDRLIQYHKKRTRSVKKMIILRVVKSRDIRG
jgi:hypothetical protein